MWKREMTEWSDWLVTENVWVELRNVKRESKSLKVSQQLPDTQQLQILKRSLLIGNPCNVVKGIQFLKQKLVIHIEDILVTKERVLILSKYYKMWEAEDDRNLNLKGKERFIWVKYTVIKIRQCSSEEKGISDSMWSVCDTSVRSY